MTDITNDDGLPQVSSRQRFMEDNEQVIEDDQQKPDKKFNRYVVVYLDLVYIKQHASIVLILQTVLSLICLMLTVSSGQSPDDYLDTPVATHLRFMVFVCVAGFLCSLSVFCSRLTHLADVLPLNWNTLDIVIWSVLSLFFLIASSLVIDGLRRYVSLMSSGTVVQLAVTVVVGYCCALIYAVTVLLTYYSCRNLANGNSEDISLSTSVASAKNGASADNPSRPIFTVDV